MFAFRSMYSRSFIHSVEKPSTTKPACQRWELGEVPLVLLAIRRHQRPCVGPCSEYVIVMQRWYIQASLAI